MEWKHATVRKKAVKDMVNALNVWNITNKTKEKPIAKEKML